MIAITHLVEMYPHVVKSITCDYENEFLNQFEIGLIEEIFNRKIYYVCFNSCVLQERGSDLTKITTDYLANIFQNRLILKIFRKIKLIKLCKG